MADFAFCDLMPRGFHLWPVVNARAGDPPISGPAQIGNWSAGFHWGLQYRGHTLNSRTDFEAWLAMVGLLVSSSPVLNMRIPQHARTLGMTATLNADAAINATVVNVNLTGGPAPVKGQYLSLFGATYQRVHLITAVGSPTGAVYPCTVIPDLRQAYSAGIAINFATPTLSMALAAGAEVEAFPDADFPLRAKPGLLMEEYLP